jgi:hypothetical protein
MEGWVPFLQIADEKTRNPYMICMAAIIKNKPGQVMPI